MTAYLDSHAHFDTFLAEGVEESLLVRAAGAGVTRIVAIGGSPAANTRALALAQRQPVRLRATAGFDRDLAVAPPPLAGLAEAAAHPLVCGIGETGLDYHYEPQTAREQQSLFAAQLDLALALGKPVIVHSREADLDTLRLLAPYAARHPRGPGGLGVLHCFTGALPFARELLALGLLISFSGIVTFKKSEALREVAAMVPDDRFLIETDAPYLAPVPHRGCTNEPAFVVEVARVLATVRGVSVEEIARQSRENACRLFDWQEDATT